MIFHRVLKAFWYSPRLTWKSFQSQRISVPNGICWNKLHYTILVLWKHLFIQSFLFLHFFFSLSLVFQLNFCVTAFSVGFYSPFQHHKTKPIDCQQTNKHTTKNARMNKMLHGRWRMMNSIKSHRTHKHHEHQNVQSNSHSLGRYCTDRNTSCINPWCCQLSVWRPKLHCMPVSKRRRLQSCSVSGKDFSFLFCIHS